MNNSVLVTGVFASMLLADTASADSQPAQTESRLDSVVATADFEFLDGSGVLENFDNKGTGIPVSEINQNWSDDLVIAPVPGYSPQLGWMLSGVAGYFMDLDKHSDDTKPSVAGAFGMISENDSYAYGVATYLHLLGDDLRVKAGAGYGDINYRYYGTGNIINRLGLSVQIRQKMPLYFASTTQFLDTIH